MGTPRAPALSQSTSTRYSGTSSIPFGRTLTEALACGTKVVAFDRGGAAESLSACFPDGLVPQDDLDAFVRRVLSLLGQHKAIDVKPEFLMAHQVEATLGVYRRLLA